MDRRTAEKRIRDLLVEVGTIAKEYGTKECLGASVLMSTGSVCFDNRGWVGGEDERAPLSYHESGIDFDAGRGTVGIGRVRAFRADCTDKEQALKPLEEAAEIYGAWQRLMLVGELYEELAVKEDVLGEIADCIQACCNLAARLGVDDMRPYMEACEGRNRSRGRID